MMFGTREAFAYVECGDCGCVQIAEIPEDLARFYPDGYYSFSPPSRPEGLRGRAIARARNRYAVFRRGFLGRRYHRRFPNRVLGPLGKLGLSRDARVLDVGCGGGEAVRDLGDLGMTHVAGTDPHLPEPTVLDNGVRLFDVELERMEGEWDVVMFHHSLEHVPDQSGTLAAAAGRLAPGGTVLVRIPVASSLAWERYGTDWVQMDPPRHLYLHTEDSLGRAAAAAGLTVADVVHDSTAFQFWGSEQYALDVPLTAPESWSTDPERSAFTPEQMASWETRAQELNADGRGDQAVFYLRGS